MATEPAHPCWGRREGGPRPGCSAQGQLVPQCLPSGVSVLPVPTSTSRGAFSSYLNIEKWAPSKPAHRLAPNHYGLPAPTLSSPGLRRAGQAGPQPRAFPELPGGLAGEGVGLFEGNQLSLSGS